jgi:hypothetical protein
MVSGPGAKWIEGEGSRNAYGRMLAYSGIGVESSDQMWVCNSVTDKAEEDEWRTV